MSDLSTIVDAGQGVRIDPEFHALIPPLDEAEREQLETNILAEGCRHALVCWRDSDLLTLVDGHNRYEICTRHKIAYEIEERVFESREDVIAWIVDNQLGRRNLPSFARGRLALSKKEAIERKALARMSAGGQGYQNSDNPVHTLKELGKEAGLSHDTMHKIEVVIENAPEHLVAAAEAQEISINRAYEMTRRLEKLPPTGRGSAARVCGDSVEKVDVLIRLHQSGGKEGSNGTYDEILATGGFHFGDDMEQWCNFVTAPLREIDAALRNLAKQHAQIEQEARRQHRVDEAIALTEELGTFPVIYADPPWRYEHVKTESRAIENHYPTMSLDEICALPVTTIAGEDCVLFLWATSPKLAEALRVMEAWGFTYRTCAVWDKGQIGMGYYFRQQHELLLVGTRGNLPVPAPSDRATSVIRSPRGEHSAKPTLVYDLIESMYPEYRKVELFARNTREGWQSWGNQAHGPSDS